MDYHSLEQAADGKQPSESKPRRVKLAVGTLLIVCGCAFGVLSTHEGPNRSDLNVDSFEAHLSRYQKMYSDEEWIHRNNLYQDKLHAIAEHNAREDATYKKGVNAMSDLSGKEFLERYTCFAASSKLLNSQRDAPPTNIDVATLPESVDWRSSGAVTDIETQGDCGACWAFVDAGAIEGLRKIKEGVLESLSVQELIDCSFDTGNWGCRGGTLEYGFDAIVKIGGIASAASYPYTEQDGSCQSTSHSASFTITGYSDVEQNNELALMAAVAEQPVGAVVQITTEWGEYESGIFNDPSCGYAINHAVLVVGYGTDNGYPYWLIKNSWGKDWGEDGYMRLTRSASSGYPGMCGIAYYPTRPVKE